MEIALPPTVGRAPMRKTAIQLLRSIPSLARSVDRFVLIYPGNVIAKLLVLSWACSTRGKQASLNLGRCGSTRRSLVKVAADKPVARRIFRQCPLAGGRELRDDVIQQFDRARHVLACQGLFEGRKCLQEQFLVDDSRGGDEIGSILGTVL